jgi:hypothetical protein
VPRHLGGFTPSGPETAWNLWVPHSCPMSMTWNAAAGQDSAYSVALVFSCRSKNGKRTFAANANPDPYFGM